MEDAIGKVNSITARANIRIYAASNAMPSHVYFPNFLPSVCLLFQPVSSQASS